MSLVTRCPECATAFRVAPAQLSARGGRVRCGSCANVFNGVAHLLLEPQRPEPDEPSPQIGLFDQREWPAAGSGAASVQRGQRDDADPTPPPQAHPVPPAAAAIAAPPIVSSAPPAETIAPAALKVLLAPEVPSSRDSLRAGAPALPEFLAERPVRREFRFAWGLLSLIAIAVLAGQVLFHFRTEAAALFPELRPQLEIGCEMLDCELRLPQRVELLSIESSDLQADASRANVLVLNAVVRNRAPFPQEFPSLELTLNNERDETVVRRVLSPADYLAGRRGPSGGIAAGSEESLRLYLEAAKVRATGYRLYLFFP